MVKSAAFTESMVKADFTDSIKSAIPNQSPRFNRPFLTIKGKTN